jgi:hypothetical protein
MIPDGFEPLSFRDNVLVSRINLSCAALGLVVFALRAQDCTWGVRSLALVAGAGLVLLARQIEHMLRRLDPATGPDHAERSHAPDRYVLPF